MSKHFGLVPLLLSALLATAAVPATAAAAPRGATLQVQTQQARFGARSFGRRPSYSPRYGSRYGRSPYTRSARRYSPFHGLGGAILKGLGIAYLFHAVFGWGGGGGSPFGLILLIGIVAYLVGRARRPRRPAYF